jgi:hypothetical protein
MNPAIESMRGIVSISIRGQHRRIPVRAAATATLAVVLLAYAACDGDSPAPAARESLAGNGGATLTSLRTFDVEENDDVVNVTPTVRIDGRGGLLVADAPESQIRRYSPEGKLLWFAGRRGQARVSSMPSSPSPAWRQVKSSLSTGTAGSPSSMQKHNG